VTGPGASHDAGLRRRWWPLAVSLAVHALLIGLWLRHADLRPVAPDAPEPLSIWLQPATQPQLPPPEPPPARQALPDKTRHAAREPVLPSAPRVAAPASPPVSQPVVEAPQPSAAEIADRARHEVGAIAAKLRAEDAVSPVRGKDTVSSLRRGGKWARFSDQLEAAHIDNGPEIIETYTAPDGRVLYRRRVGGKVICRQSGSVGPAAPWSSGGAVLGGAGSQITLGMGGLAGDVACPESARDWKRQ
jgi:hypothetical protein